MASLGLGQGLTGLSQNIFDLLKQKNSDKSAADEKEFRNKQFQLMMQQFLAGEQDKALNRADSQQRNKEVDVRDLLSQLPPGPVSDDVVKQAQGTTSAPRIQSVQDSGPTLPGAPPMASTNVLKPNPMQVQQMQDRAAAQPMDDAKIQELLASIDQMKAQTNKLNNAPPQMSEAEKLAKEHEYRSAEIGQQGSISLANQKALANTVKNLTPAAAAQAYLKSFGPEVDQDDAGVLRPLLMDVIKQDPTIAAALAKAPPPSPPKDGNGIGNIPYPPQAQTQATPGMLQRFLNGAKGAPVAPQAPVESMPGRTTFQQMVRPPALPTTPPCPQGQQWLAGAGKCVQSGM